MAAFNIRVYGLFVDGFNRILVSDEFRFGKKMTKFPGGGLKYGEGTIGCLKREIQEETGLGIKNIRHFYTTDFFQKALHFDEQQLISIYYLAEFEGADKLKLSKERHSYKADEEEPVSFVYISLNDITEDDLSFPIDKYVLGLLKKHYNLGK